MLRFLRSLIPAVAVLLGADGCSRTAKGPIVFDTAEAAAKYVKSTTFSEATFTLAISNNFTFVGRPDTVGAGMAVVLDAILGKGYWPDGFEQRDGHCLYRYKRDQGLDRPKGEK
jgi:hypothetical protein